MKICQFSFCILFIVSGVFTSSIIAQTYEVIDLGTPDGTSQARGINDSGQVVGVSQSHAFLWENGVMTDLGTLGGSLSYAFGINDAGQVVGYSQLPGDLAYHAFLWENGVMTDLGTLGGYQSYAYGINNAGQVVGYSNLPTVTDTLHAFLWENGVMTDLGTLVGETHSYAYGINDSGQVVGYSYDQPTLIQNAFLWENGVMTNLGTLGGTLSHAHGINDAGQVVGYSSLPGDSAFNAFLWENGVMTDLGNLGGNSNAYGINGAGQVVGWSNYPYAVLWENGVIADLNDLIDPSPGWTLRTAYGINNNGEIVGYGGLPGTSLHAFLLRPAFAITSPQAGELWIAGERDTIRWTSTGIDSVGISFSVNFENGGGSFEYIVENYPDSSGYYVWDIPENIMSRKCAISVEDASDGTMSDISDVFKIKGYILTRIDANGDYEAFRPEVHGWSFANTGVNIWPQSWWQQFDYANGTDPFIDMQYAPAFTAWPINAIPSDFPDWEAFVRTFGTDQCYWTPVSGFLYYSPVALMRWRLIKGGWGGSCHGFAASSLAAFDHYQEFIDWFGLSSFDDLISVALDTLPRNINNEHWLYQFGGVQASNYFSNHTKSPVETLSELKAMFLNEEGDNRFLSFFENGEDDFGSGGIGSGGHAVVPYKLVKDPGNADLEHIYVYDNNYPSDTTQRITINTALNGWDANSGWDGTSDLFLTDPTSEYLRVPSLELFRFLQAPVSGRGEGSGTLLAFTTPSSFITIVNQEDSIGYADSTVYNTFDDAAPIVPQTGYPHPPIGYMVPEGEYDVRLFSASENEVYLAAFSDSSMLMFGRTDAQAGQTDLLSFGDGMGLRNPDQASKTINLRALLVGQSDERVFDILGCTTIQGDSLFANVDDAENLSVANVGSMKQYVLRLEQVSMSGNPHFEAPAVVFAANSAHQIAPDWTDLASVSIYVDLGNNGTIDDTLIVVNTVDVGDTGNEGLPNEYALFQNYPNPFNPQTRISYALPQESHVTLKIYNILGQEVVTLVNGIEDPGERSVLWNAQAVSSGVYFYRLHVTAADGSVYLDSRKMVLLK